MPTYSVRDNDTGEMEELFMSYSSLQEYLKENPSKESVITSAPMIIGGTGVSGFKVDNGFNEVLQKVGEAHPNSNLADRYVKKSSKDIKTQAVVDKHRKIQQKRKS
tara:strand:+ start:279 stop:596 length:318 start_codon:yes stop_codon:yes gene_type:complete